MAKYESVMYEKESLRLNMTTKEKEIGYIRKSDEV